MVGDTLTAISNYLRNDFGLRPVLGAEIEFYVPGASAELIKQLEDSAGFTLEKEKGRHQYEIALPPTHDPLALAQQLAALKENIPADFSPRPFADQPGSGIHVHLHLEDGTGRNVLLREGDDYSPQLLHAIGGMLALMQESMVLFAPSPASYARFVDKGNAPLTVSWGPNNRTVAIRLPNAPMEHKRIEHRVAGSDADPMQVIAAVLAGAHYGLTHKIDPGAPVHGDASLPVYAKERLVGSHEAAKEYFERSGKLRNYLSAAAS